MRPKKQPTIEFKHQFLWMTFLTLCAVCCAVTVEAVFMGRDVTNGIKTRTLLVFCAACILNAPLEMCAKIFGLFPLPAAVVAMVAIGAVGVFNALRRTFVIDTGLKILLSFISLFAQFTCHGRQSHVAGVLLQSPS